MPTEHAVLVLGVALTITLCVCAHLWVSLDEARKRPFRPPPVPLLVGQVWRRRGGTDQLKIRSQYPDGQWRVENVANGKSTTVDGRAILARWDFTGVVSE